MQWAAREPFPVKLYSAAVALLPVFAAYASGIPGFSAADVLLAACCVMAVFTGGRRNEFTVRPVPVAAALYLMVLFDLLTMLVQREPEYFNILIRTVRYFFYLAVVVLCSRRMLDLTRCKRAVKAVAVLATAYIFVQFGMYRLFGLILKGYLPFLRLYVEGYASTDYASLYAAMYRPTSFFLEPAHYARYAAVGVALFLFDGEGLSLRELSGAVFLSAGILVSTSAQGYLLLAVVWLICLGARLKRLNSAGLKTIFFLGIMLLPAILAGLFQLSFVREAVSRAMNIDFSDLTNENTALGARLGGFSYYWKLPSLYRVIGMGFGVVPEEGWLSSAAYWLYGSGCLIFGLFLAYGIQVLSRARGSARIVALIFLLLFFSDDSFYSYLCVLFISLSCLRPAERLPGREGA